MKFKQNQSNSLDAREVDFSPDEGRPWCHQRTHIEEYVPHCWFKQCNNFQKSVYKVYEFPLTTVTVSYYSTTTQYVYFLTINILGPIF